MDPIFIQKDIIVPHPEYFFAPPYCRKLEYPKEEFPALKTIVSNPAKILKLCEKLSDSSSKPLEVKINNYLMKESESEMTFLIHLLPRSEEAFVQVIGAEELEKELRFPVSECVMKDLVQYVNERLLCKDNLDPQIVTILTGVYKHLGRNFNLVPILKKGLTYYSCSTENLKPELLVCFVDSKKDEDFLRRLANELFMYCQTVLLNAVTTEEELRFHKKYMSLLTTIRDLFGRLENIDDLFKNIVFQTKKLLNVRRCSLFLLDREKVKFIRKVFEVDAENKFGTNLHVVKDQAIVKKVITTGKLLNIGDAQEHPLFDKSVEEGMAVKTRNILCFPIRNEECIMGAIQASNKRRDEFSVHDEEVAKTFGIYCGLSICHTTIYKRVNDNLEKMRLSNELMIAYKSVADEEVRKRLVCCYQHEHPQWDQFDFPPTSIVPSETVCFVLKMAEELGFVKRFRIKKDRLAKFVLLVQKCHDEQMPFHNWTHTFCVTHFAYLLLKKWKVVEKGYLSNLEAFAYFLACLCHNIDHRGVNNPFQEKTLKTLTSMYSSPGSVMQRHHLTQTLAILNSEGCNFLESLGHEDYNLCLTLFKDFLMASDLLSHFKIYSKEYLMSEKGYNNTSPIHRYVLSNLLMTCACFSEQVKNWSDVKLAMTGMIEEFIILGYVQDKGGRNPILLPQENMRLVPDLMVQLLRTACLSAFKLLAMTFPEAKELVYTVKKNILYWEASRCLFKNAYVDNQSCIEVLKSEDLETKIQEVIDTLLNET